MNRFEFPRVTYPNVLGEKLDVDYHQKLSIKFQIKDKQNNEFIRVQQAFLRWTNKKSNKEVIYLAEASTGAHPQYKVDVVRTDSLRATRSLRNESFEISVHCFAGFHQQCQRFPSTVRRLWTGFTRRWRSVRKCIRMEATRSDSSVVSWRWSSWEESSELVSAKERNHPSVPWRRKTTLDHRFTHFQCLDRFTLVGSIRFGKWTSLVTS